MALKESIPLSQVASPVSSIRPELMRATGTYRPNSLSGMVPGLHIPDYGASLTSTIYLRGLGSRMENPVLGLYVDGIPILDKNAYDFDWEAVRSVTLLRGPQGTLYGRNSMGGVLAIRTLPFSSKSRIFLGSPFVNFAGIGKLGKLPILVNKVLLEHSPTH